MISQDEETLFQFYTGNFIYTFYIISGAVFAALFLAFMVFGLWYIFCFRRKVPEQ